MKQKGLKEMQGTPRGSFCGSKSLSPDKSGFEVFTFKRFSHHHLIPLLIDEIIELQLFGIRMQNKENQNFKKSQGGQLT